MNKNSKIWKWLRGVLIFFIPFVVAVIIYVRLSPSQCFTSNSSLPQAEAMMASGIVDQEISDYILKTTNQIQSLAPILQLGNDWFKFDISFKNEFKVAIVVSRPESYTVATTTFYILKNNSSTTIEYGKEVTLAKGLDAKDINGLTPEIGYRTNNKPIVVGPHEYVTLQTNPNLGKVCLDVMLEPKYFFLVLLEIWIVVAGIIILAKESIRFVDKGFRE